MNYTTAYAVACAEFSGYAASNAAHGSGSVEYAAERALADAKEALAASRRIQDEDANT